MRSYCSSGLRECSRRGAIRSLRTEAESRFAEHWVHHSRSTLGWDPTEEEIRGAMPPVRWPLVRVHPGSGRKVIYIGAHARRVMGMALPAGQIVNLETESPRIAQLFRSTIVKMDGDAPRYLTGGVFYGFSAPMHSNLLIVRWNATNILWLKGEVIPDRQVRAAFAPPGK